MKKLLKNIQNLLLKNGHVAIIDITQLFGVPVNIGTFDCIVASVKFLGDNVTIVVENTNNGGEWLHEYDVNYSELTKENLEEILNALEIWDVECEKDLKRLRD